MPARTLRGSKSSRASLAQVGLSRSHPRKGGTTRRGAGTSGSAKRPKLEQPISVPKTAGGRKRRAAAAKDGEEQEQEEDDDDDDDDDDDGASYQVDRLLASRRQRGGIRQFLVRWPGSTHTRPKGPLTLTLLLTLPLALP